MALPSSSPGGSPPPPATPLRVHRRRLTRLTTPSTSSGYATAFLRSPVASRRPSVPSEPVQESEEDDEFLRQFSNAQLVEPNELSQLLQDHLNSEASVIEEEPELDPVSIYVNIRGYSPYGDDMASPNAFPSLDTSLPPAGNRMANASPTAPSSLNGSNGINGPGSGAAAAAGYMSLPVGHQQDLNHLFNQIQELGTLLRSNREKVNSITRNAEEVAKRASGALTEGEPAQPENDKARIRELELELAKQKQLVELYKHEQKENTGLIAMYEEAMGTAVEQIRNYCGDIEGRFLRQRKHYNDLLQQEKDDHLQSRLDRDNWYAQTLKVCEMIRTAHRLRTDEWCEEYTIIAALQGEVRCLRRCLGMEPEKPEEETGWPYLKDLPLPE
ncbi:uncharacterized protein Z520_07976 [Fonsecaea multimorphosa CBS 102226]|uniref:Uncharacterized protein n=1 Tax=Fonsecaea multimorphosa CBS 102226 TaxID=1442371 RepID=A0A0D2KHP2_9EURO|nr:uncharacterized protein Z520_07976 [Fonsecaea multimorphosa CBS 102226]KIX96198.1 hypothetical protein Z520_07976 [Fonsecaea multimorphosa CBS 102226]OAL22225.1 hypothetical protein AYO22_07269 [Fonsecaea multimorphosa]